jgi:NAD(P)H-hydrate epimerase
MGALPDYCEPLYDAQSMRAIDRWAIGEQGVPSLDLMERAGLGVARIVEQLAPDGPVAVLCGKGNNGGDGFVVARLLRQAGRPVSVICTTTPEELSGDTAVNLKRLPGEPPLLFGDRPAREEIMRAHMIVDALLGTGSAGSPHGTVAQAIELANTAAAPVVSVDVPSGVDASTGVVAGDAVHAHVTVTFHAAKPGLWINPGKRRAGQVRVIDIGIPKSPPARASIGLIGESVLEALPRRKGDSTKFTSGHVLVAGGSRGLTGAPRMTAHAAMRSGAGYVSACVPASLQTILAGATPELMTHGLPEQDGALSTEGIQDVLQAAERGGALALGPGLGRAEGAAGFARALAERVGLPMVLDADGLNAHAGRLQDLRGRQAHTVCTPHAGELGRLLGLKSEEIEAERLRHVRAAADIAQAVIVLKGDDTLIAAPDGTVAVNRGGSPALATAGTGDVLTGVIASLLAQRLDPFLAACAGVCLHACAGREAARRVGSVEGVIATDVIEALPAVRAGAGNE